MKMVNFCNKCSSDTFLCQKCVKEKCSVHGEYNWGHDIGMKCGAVCGDCVTAHNIFKKIKETSKGSSMELAMCFTRYNSEGHKPM